MIEVGRKVTITASGLSFMDKWAREHWMGRVGTVMRIRGHFADLRDPDSSSEIVVHVDKLKEVE